LNENGPRFCNAFIIKLGFHWNWNAKTPSPCMSISSVKQLCLNNIFTLFHGVEKD
jgi:hypothetical protein